MIVRNIDSTSANFQQVWIYDVVQTATGNYAAQLSTAVTSGQMPGVLGPIGLEWKVAGIIGCRHAQARGRVLLRLCHSLPPCHGARGGTSRDGQGRISRPLPQSTRPNSRLNANVLAAFNSTVVVERPRVVLFEFSDGWVEACFHMTKEEAERQTRRIGETLPH